MIEIPRPLPQLGSASPFDPLLALRRAIATELAVMAFEAKRRTRAHLRGNLLATPPTAQGGTATGTSVPNPGSR